MMDAMLLYVVLAVLLVIVIVLLAFGLASLRSYGETRKYIMYVSDDGKIKIKRYRPRNSVGRW